MSVTILKSPLAGWSMPLSELPDPVFSQGMAGDGVAIDPIAGVLCAPCDGEVVPMQNARHAVTLRTPAGHEILMHVGIDTVKLHGDGFTLLVEPGRRVFAGQALLRFDLDRVARGASSLATPILLATPGQVVRRVTGCQVNVGDVLMEVAGEHVAAESGPAGAEEVRYYNVPFDHGLHARPAATLANALKPFDSTVTLVSRGRHANARSVVSMLSLGIRRNDVVEVRAAGNHVAQVYSALDSVLVAVAASSADVQTAPAAVTPASGMASLKSVAAVPASPGRAVGKAVNLVEAELPVSETGGEPSAERLALHAALSAVRSHLWAQAAKSGGTQAQVLAAHVELIGDPELVRSAEEWIARGKSAAFAWRTSVRDSAGALQRLSDPHLRERIADLSDLERQVLHVLAGADPAQTRELPADSIILADELLPSQLVSLDISRVGGICMAQGGPTSHVAIIAASMGIPALVAAGARVLEIQDGTPLIVDADRGVLSIDPDEAELRAAALAVSGARAQREIDLAHAVAPALTRDGERVSVFANLGGFEEVAPALTKGAEGCGLLRTEFLFLDRRDAPGLEEQANLYGALAEALGNRPLTIRTMDIGGDKPIPYLPLPKEENPALGLRGLRTSLWQPDLLRTQVAAILRVAAQPSGKSCRILLPMVTDVGDVRAVRKVIDELRGSVPAPALGVMIETPASALLVGQFLSEVDFVSIGTNDLSQYTLAIDRGHPQLASRLDALHPAVLALIARVADAASGTGKEVAVCGGLASDPLAVPVLIGLGVHELSAVPAAIPAIKRIVRGLDTRECAALANAVLQLPDAAAVRERVTPWVAQRVVQGAAPGTVQDGGQ